MSPEATDTPHIRELLDAANEIRALGERIPLHLRRVRVDLSDLVRRIYAEVKFLRGVTSE